jgi:multiple sugar transport system ATP-binding protein
LFHQVQTKVQHQGKDLATIELRQLSKRFSEDVDALMPLDLTVKAGELLVVLGPSGSGKSTLLRLIAGLEPPSSGGVWIDGRDMTRVPSYRRDVAMVFQNAALYPHLSVFDNMAFGLRGRDLSRSQARLRVNTLAGVLGLDHVLARDPSALSGGERQRVAIGRALAREPRVVLFDEPFSNLDVPLRAALREQVMELHRRSGMTMIHVTHDQAEALVMGDRIMVLDRGRLLQCGAARAIYDRPAHRFVATFVGSPPMNLLPCQIEGAGESIRVVPLGTDTALAWEAAGLSIPGQVPLPPGSEGTTRVFDLGLRPEAITIADASDPKHSPGTGPRLIAHVRRTEFNGPELLVALAVGPHNLWARVPASQTIQDRQRVAVTVDPVRTVWFDQSTGEAISPT